MPDFLISCAGAHWGRGWWLAWLLLLLPLAGRAQIVDDTTRLLYGPRTTLVVREVNVLRNLPEGSPLDTTINGLQQSRYWFHDSTFQQDLGNIGTASRRLLWQLNTTLGARFGRTAFDKYFHDPTTVNYYDTRSPFSFFRFVQGGQGEGVFEGSYSRSIKKTANLGIAYERFSGDKQLARLGRDDGLTAHTGILLFGRYQTQDNRYQLQANYYIGRHRAAEQGGIRPQPEDSTLANLFGYNLERVWLTQALNLDNRDRFHLAHTYRLVGRGLTAFHVFDWHRQLNQYTDRALQYESGQLLYYPRTRLDSTRTDDRAEYRQAENTVGFLGRTDFLEYRVYGRHRAARLDFRNLSDTPPPEELRRNRALDTLANQIFVGGNVAFRWREVFRVEAAGEYKFFDEYWLRGGLRFGPLTAELARSAYAPTFTETLLEGNHYGWRNQGTAFRNTIADQLSVSIDQRLSRKGARLQQRVQAAASVVNLQRLVFYNQRAEPEQLGGSKQLLTGLLRHQLSYGVLHADNQLHLTQGGDGEGLRIPGVVANLKVYAQGYLFKKALFSQVGIETYYQSRWRPYDYSPSTQQFFVQDYFTAGGFPVVDAFVTADIKTVSVFLKMAHANQGLGRLGYFAAPYYTGNPRSFQLGIRWNFFD
ncbi:putative porin [Hymenobacter sp. B81]|uniref:putative porin n=1 Tax=Hymenobacter sp. B81 TaxID=3344878 RepID=UPI0037DCA2A3